MYETLWLAIDSFTSNRMFDQPHLHYQQTSLLLDWFLLCLALAFLLFLSVVLLLFYTLSRLFCNFRFLPLQWILYSAALVSLLVFFVGLALGLGDTFSGHGFWMMSSRILGVIFSTLLLTVYFLIVRKIFATLWSWRPRDALEVHVRQKVKEKNEVEMQELTEEYSERLALEEPHDSTDGGEFDIAIEEEGRIAALRVENEDDDVKWGREPEDFVLGDDTISDAAARVGLSLTRSEKVEVFSSPQRHSWRRHPCCARTLHATTNAQRDLLVSVGVCFVAALLLSVSMEGVCNKYSPIGWSSSLSRALQGDLCTTSPCLVYLLLPTVNTSTSMTVVFHSPISLSGNGEGENAGAMVSYYQKTSRRSQRYKRQEWSKVRASEIHVQTQFLDRYIYTVTLTDLESDSEYGIAVGSSKHGFTRHTFRTLPAPYSEKTKTYPNVRIVIGGDIGLSDEAASLLRDANALEPPPHVLVMGGDIAYEVSNKQWNFCARPYAVVVTVLILAVYWKLWFWISSRSRSSSGSRQ